MWLLSYAQRNEILHSEQMCITSPLWWSIWLTILFEIGVHWERSVQRLFNWIITITFPLRLTLDVVAVFFLEYPSRPQRLSRCMERFGPLNNPYSGGKFPLETPAPTSKSIHPHVLPHLISQTVWSRNVRAFIASQFREDIKRKVLFSFRHCPKEGGGHRVG